MERSRLYASKSNNQMVMKEMELKTMAMARKQTKGEMESKVR